MEEFLSVSVIIPAVNETESLRENVETVMRTCAREDLEEILFVVCEKTTPECLKTIGGLMNAGAGLPMTLCRQKRPGIGPAIRESLDRVKAAHAVYLAADTDTDAAVVSAMIEAAKRRPAAIICASRWLKGGGFEGYGRGRVVLNYLFQKMLQVLFFTRLTDLTYGYRLFPVKTLLSVTWEDDSFSFGMETSLKCLRLGCEFCEVPAVWRARCQGKSQNSPTAKLKYIGTVLKVRFARADSFVNTVDGKAGKQR